MHGTTEEIEEVDIRGEGGKRTGDMATLFRGKDQVGWGQTLK